MKKMALMMMVAEMSTLLNAATCWWFETNNPIYDGYNATVIGGKSQNAVGAGLKVYLVYYTYVGNSYRGVSQANLLMAIRNAGGSSAMTDKAIVPYVLARSLTAPDGKVNKIKFQTDTSFLPLDAAEEMTAYMVIFSSDEKFVYIDDSWTHRPTTVFYVTTECTRTLRDNAGTVGCGAAGWYAVHGERADASAEHRKTNTEARARIIHERGVPAAL